MIYISTSCSESRSIGEVIEDFAGYGIRQIELSGGMDYEEDLETKLFRLQDRYDLDFLLHNYFPPPEEAFVLNLASLDEEIWHKSLDHYRKAIQLSKKLGAKRFGLHAGFFIHLGTKDLGGYADTDVRFDRDLAINRFCEGYKALRNFSGDVKLYVENNVLSITNRERYTGFKPFMLLDDEDLQELKSRLDFPLLTDAAHLKVSANTLGFDFEPALKSWVHISDFLHLSDNDGEQDSNQPIEETSDLYRQLKQCNLNNKTISLEIKAPLDAVLTTRERIEKIISQ